MPSGTVRIGAASVDFDRLLIAGESGSSSIEPKVMDVLGVLYDRAGDVISREELIDTVWGVAHGGDEGLTRAISLLRKALGEKPRQPTIIETISKRGYRMRVVEGIEAPPQSEEAQGASRSGFSPPAQSIAILPFVNMTPEAEHDFFIDGVTEEIINALAQMSDLKVTGRTSSFAFKGQNKDVREIAGTLNVAYVLEGSLRKQGNQIRITAQLIDAQTGFHLWSQKYDEIISDAFKIQDSIATSILDSLSDVLQLPKQQAIKTRITKNPEAYSLFLQGRQLTHQLNGQTTLPTAIKLLERAVSLDPKLADAWSWLALAHSVISEFSYTEDWENHHRIASELVEHCLSIAPLTHMAWHTRGNIALRKMDFDQSIVCFEKAHEIAPNDPETMIGLGYAYSSIGLHQKARPFVEEAIARDPLCAVWYAMLGGIELMSGALMAAKKAMRRSFELGFGPAAFTVALVIDDQLGPKQAVAYLNDNFEGFGPNEKVELRSPIKRKFVFDAFFGQKPIATWLVAREMKWRLRRPTAQPTTLSIMAFYFMDRPGDLMQAILAKQNPYLGYVTGRFFEKTKRGDRLRTHPHFPEFAKKVGFVKAWEKHGWPDMVKEASFRNEF